MKLIFFGPPGAGKGTHADHISEDYGIPKISVGEIFRDEVKEGTALGKKVKNYMEKGVLVPSEVTIGVLKRRLAKPDCKKGFILDGFPRDLQQAQALEKITKIDLVVNFTLSKETIMQRLTGRLTCRKCQRVFNIFSDPPKTEGYCNDCGKEGELFVRKDQKPDVIKQRLKTYKEETAPLIDFYRKKGILSDFSSEGPVDEVRKRIKKFIKEQLK